MTNPLLRLPLRVRVALAFTATTGVLLTVLGAFLYFAVEDTLLDRTRTSLTSQLDALEAVPSARRGEVLEHLSPAYGQLLDKNGAVVSSSASVTGPLLGRSQLPTGSATVERENSVQLAEQSEPEHALLLSRRAGTQILVVGTSREDVADDLQVVLVRLLIGSVVGLALASLLGYVVAGAALRPIERMRRRAELISARHSSERLPVPSTDDELQRLGLTLNEMLDRLDAGLQRERRFVAEAGHELRTPLAMLRMELDLALSKDRTTDELVDAVRSAGEEVDRLAGLAEDLLLLASPERTRPAADVPVVDVVHHVVDRYAVAASHSGRAVDLDVAGRPVVRGDAESLERALRNLVDNALRHGVGDVRVAVEVVGSEAHIDVSDAGPGPGADATDGEGTSGLGLRIVRAILEEQGGRLEAVAQPDGHVVMRVVLPLGAVAAT